MNLAWYAARLRRMGPRELASRVRDEGLKLHWRRLKGRGFPPPAQASGTARAFAPVLSDPRLEAAALGSILAVADELLAGRLRIFGHKTALPVEFDDWFRDSKTGVLAPSRTYAFDIDTRDAAIVGNHKFLLEPSRLQHVQLLAGAFFLSGREAYAELASRQLQSWWRANPFLSGVHWTSGIEVGLRLVSFAWVRRLLGAWPGIESCFEGDKLAREQIYWHQLYLAKLRSHGSSANNHLLAELLGLYVGTNAFPWFPESRRWGSAALRDLQIEASRQVFRDGLSREQASDYHGFVLELLLVAAVETMLSGNRPDPAFLAIIARMADAWAALLDCRLRPPRQGDSDEGIVLQLGAMEPASRPGSLLAAAGAVVGKPNWWPAVAEDFRSRLFAALSAGRAPGAADAARPQRRPNIFPEAGVVMLRDFEPREDELWCRCDHGPHGFLAIAAHAHADALSLELRHGGVDILADPGTFCYRTELDFRRYFRSTIAHNALEIGGVDQARFGGPFLWLDAPRSELLQVEGLDDGPRASWSARHEGYRRQPGTPVHSRSVTLDREARALKIVDRVDGSGEYALRLAFHLGPDVAVTLDGARADLSWTNGAGRWRGKLDLPEAMVWREYRGARDPICGWYSPGFGERRLATSLIGEARLPAFSELRAILRILPAGGNVQASGLAEPSGS